MGVVVQKFPLVSDRATFRSESLYPAYGTIVFLQGTTTPNDGGQCFYQVDLTDKSTADNGGSCLVDLAGYRWFRSTLPPAAGGILPISEGGTGASTAVGAIDNLDTQGADIASAATTDLSAATGIYVNVTGTTTISALGTAAAGVIRWVKFTGNGTLTYNATSLILPGQADISRKNGDFAGFISLGSGNWQCFSYTEISGGTPGTLPVSEGGTGATTLTSHGVLIGNGTSAVTVTAAGTSTTVLHGNASGDPTFGAVSLTADVTGTLPVANGGTGRTAVAPPTIQAFTSSGTYTPPAGITAIIVELRGGGGGGGGVSNTAADVLAAGGGGEGGYARKRIAAGSLGATETVTVGAGGTAGANTGGTGGTGGTTSFGAQCSATGGAGGQGKTTSGNSAGGDGGIGSSGDLNLKGQGGGPGLGITATGGIAGIGGGEGGGRGKAASGAGIDGANGGGGAGATNISAATAAIGGAGGGGWLIVTEYYN